MSDDPFELETLSYYIRNEGSGFLSLQQEIADGGVLLGYRCVLRLQSDDLFVTGVVDLYTVEQAKVVIHEALRQQIRLMVATVQSQKRARARRKKVDS